MDMVVLRELSIDKSEICFDKKCYNLLQFRSQATLCARIALAVPSVKVSDLLIKIGFTHAQDESIAGPSVEQALASVIAAKPKNFIFHSIASLHRLQGAAHRVDALGFAAGALRPGEDRNNGEDRRGDARYSQADTGKDGREKGHRSPFCLSSIRAQIM
jgi:hypothetical protein